MYLHRGMTSVRVLSAKKYWRGALDISIQCEWVWVFVLRDGKMAKLCYFLVH